MRLGGQDLAPPSQPGQMDRGRLQRIALMAVGALMAGAPLFPFTVSFRSTAYTQALPVRSLFLSYVASSYTQKALSQLPPAVTLLRTVA